MVELLTVIAIILWIAFELTVYMLIDQGIGSAKARLRGWQEDRNHFHLEEQALLKDPRKILLRAGDSPVDDSSHLLRAGSHNRDESGSTLLRSLPTCCSESIPE